MKRLMMVVAVALLAAAPALAQAPQGRAAGHGRMGGPMMGPGPMAILRGLNLTDEQRQQIKSILDENRPAEPPQSMQLERKLHAAIIGGDAGAVEAIKTQLLQAHEQELDRQITILQRIAPILTAEQKQQLLNRR
jgi:protein CpxP